MMIIARSLFIVALSTILGCASGNSGVREFPEQAVASLKIGVTTNDSVIGLLGEPEKKIPLRNGSEVWIYSYCTKRSNDADGSVALYESVRLKFTGTALTDIVRGSSSVQSNATEVGRPFDSKAISELPAGTLGPDDVIARFGPPSSVSKTYDGNVRSVLYSYYNARDGSTTALLSFDNGKLKNVRVHSSTAQQIRAHMSQMLVTNWQKLTKGMSQDEVDKLIGPLLPPTSEQLSSKITNGIAGWGGTVREDYGNSTGQRTDGNVHTIYNPNFSLQFVAGRLDAWEAKGGLKEALGSSSNGVPRQ